MTAMMMMIMMILEQHQEVYAQTQPNSTAAATNTTTPLVNNQTQVINATNQTITTTLSDREIDILWNEIIDGCLELHHSGGNLVESGCDGEFMVNDRNLDCEAYENQLLICDANTSLGMKFQSYLNTIGYSTG